MSRFLNGIIKARGRSSDYMSDGKIGQRDVFFSLTVKDEQRMIGTLITWLKGYEVDLNKATVDPM